jgi:deoxycytidylate deaminase
MVSKLINTSFLDKIITKRNCLSNHNNSTKRADTIKHTAVLFNKRGDVLGIGNNQYLPNIKHGYSEHAEVNVIQKTIAKGISIKGRSIYKHKIPTSLLVIRTTMVNSHPCYNCIQSMIENPVFNIQRVYYSCDGEIKYKSLTEMKNSDEFHICKAVRSTSYLNCTLDDEEDDGEDNEESAKPILRR